MNKVRLTLSALFLLPGALLLTQPVQAGDMTGLGVGAKISTLGGGVEIAGTITDSLNLRLGLQGFSYDFDDTYSDIDYNADVDFFSGLLLADWFPFNNNFRLSAGVAVNNNELTVTGEPRNGTYNIGGVTYPSALVGALTGTIDFNTVAPYAGIGYGGAFSDTGNWSFSFDLGVLFQGSPNVSYSAAGPLAGNAIFQANLEQERKELEDDLDEYEYYPVLSLGVTYKF